MTAVERTRPANSRNKRPTFKTKVLFLFQNALLFPALAKSPRSLNLFSCFSHMTRVKWPRKMRQVYKQRTGT